MTSILGTFNNITMYTHTHRNAMQKMILLFDSIHVRTWFTTVFLSIQQNISWNEEKKIIATAAVHRFRWQPSLVTQYLNYSTDDTIKAQHRKKISVLVNGFVIFFCFKRAGIIRQYFFFLSSSLVECVLDARLRPRSSQYRPLFCMSCTKVNHTKYGIWFRILHSFHS